MLRARWVGCALALMVPVAACSSAPDAERSAAGERVGSTEQAATARLPTYHSGPVMHGTPGVYFIWYGDWSADGAMKSAASTFIRNLSGSSYFGISGTYADSVGPAATHLSLKGQVTMSTPFGTNLTRASFRSIVERAISNNGLPTDDNAIYVVFTGRNIKQANAADALFCTSYCGWHSYESLFGKTVKIAHVGDPWHCDAEGHVGACDYRTIGVTSTPHGPQTDAFLGVLAHELNETVTDPLQNAWYVDNAAHDEGADICAWKMGVPQIFNMPLSRIGNVAMGSDRYYLQSLYYKRDAAGHGACAFTTAATANSEFTCPEDGEQPVNGICYPSCGNAGGNTCGAAGSTVCNGRQLFASYDCGVCCYVPPPPTLGTYPKPTQCGVITSGQAMTPGDYLYACDGLSFLVYQGDGNVVLYERYPSFNVALWSTGTAGQPLGGLVMQSDGNLVLYTQNLQVLWNSGTAGYPGGRVQVQDDCKLVAAIGGTATWATNTACRYDAVGYGQAFNANWLTAYNPDVASYGASHGWGPINYQQWWESSDANRCRQASPVFHTAAYLSMHPDVNAAYGGSCTGALNHWLATGNHEGRQSSAQFSPRAYLARYADIANAYGPHNYGQAAIHFMNTGIYEGRYGGP